VPRFALRRVVLRNYRSIDLCDVRPGRVSYLVGPNGAGKSNFLDALRLVTESLTTTLDHALRDRGGVKQVRRLSTGHPRNFTIDLRMQIDEAEARYLVEVGAGPRGQYVVQREHCRVQSTALGQEPHSFTVRAGVIVETTEQVLPPATADRLLLVAASGLSVFRPVFDTLGGIGVYNINPDRVRDLQDADSGDLLRRDGSNLAAVLSRLARGNPTVKARIEAYLAAVVPGLESIDAGSVGPKEQVVFRQRVQGSGGLWSFPAANMSDGTLRAAAVLTALLAPGGGARPSSIVAIEEPESALHPAAAGVLRDAIDEASALHQVLVTSHSPDLLDDPDIDPRAVLAVRSNAGSTVIGPVDEVGRSAMRDHLYTAGELLRLDQLEPDRSVGPVEDDWTLWSVH